MPITTKIFQFNSDSQGWQFSDPSHGRWDSVSNSLQVDYIAPSGSGFYTTTGEFSWYGNWQDLGVPPGFNVTQIELVSVDTKVINLGSSGSVTEGPFDLYQSGNSTLQANLRTSNVANAVDSTWNTLSGDGVKAVPSVIQPSTSAIELRINNTEYIPASGQNTNYYDNIRYNITSTAPTFTGNAALSTQHVVLTEAGSDPRIYYRANSLLAKNVVLQASGNFIPKFTGSANLVVNKNLNGTGTVLSPINRTMSLYMNGISVGTSDIIKNIPLNIVGKDIVNNSITLYMTTPSGASNTIPLFISGPAPSTEFLNLFLKANPIPFLTKNIPLTVYGGTSSTNAHRMGSISLYMPKSPPYQHTLNLYINGVAKKFSVNENLNLFLQAQPKIISTIPLFIKNEQTIVQNELTLYIKGLGKNPGYIPSAGKLNMFIDGFGSGRFSSPVSINGTIPLLVNGVIKLVAIQDLQNILPLYLQTDTSFPANADLDLYISGTVPPQISATIPLIIYKTKLSGTSSLYIHGF